MTESNKSNYAQAMEILLPFSQKNIFKANVQFFFTFILLWSSMIAAWLLYEISPWWCLVFIPITTVFMCRSYVIEHDCGHQSFYHSRFWNGVVGNILGFPIMIPYAMWKFIHDSHHNNVGNLDRRDMNPEMWTMTVKEYKQSSAFKRRAYQFIRSKFSRFVVAPFIIFGVIFRLPNKRFDTRSNITVLAYDLLYALLIYFFMVEVSFLQILLVYLIPLNFFFTIASYVFYAQHQFEDTYWENEENWSYEEASFNGSTYLTAPAWFNWISGNVVYHNIHHLISTIPNYNLSQAQIKLDDTLKFRPISIFHVYHLLNLKVWDEEQKKLVAFPERD